MKIVWIKGGLGNQMFQYAFYKSLEKKNENVKIDISSFKYYKKHNGFELQKIFDINYTESCLDEIKRLSRLDYKPTTKILRKINLFKKTEYLEKKPMEFDEDVFSQIDSDTYFIGYWQNEKYFKDVEDDIRKNYQFKSFLDEKNKKISESIVKENSVSIHVRRGDYISEGLYTDICNSSYYKKAINLIINKIEKPTFYVFSDDINWCIEEFTKYKDMYKFTFIDWNVKEKSYLDMQLMSLCGNNIIANSTFSWWAAWLNNKKNKIVVAPKEWINTKQKNKIDIIPKYWIKV